MADELAATRPHLLVIVNGNERVFGPLHTFLDACRYDVMFMEAENDTYRRIKTMQPGVVIVCPGAERLWDVHLLTMLSLDPEVSDISVFTCDIDREKQHCDSPRAGFH
jgi:hypothetical protein